MIPTGFDQGMRLVFAGTHRRAENVRPHAHPCPELILIVKGDCDVELDDGTLHAGPGDMIAMPARRVHNQVSNGYIETVYLGFSEPTRLSWIRPTVLSLGDSTFIRECMNLLAGIHSKQVSASPAAADAVLLAVLEQLSSRLQQQEPADSVPVGLRAAMQYINDHLAEPIAVEDVARHAGMSESNLHLLFRQRLSTSPMRYLLRQRMQAACALLQDPYLMVKQVAVMCGYDDVNHFIRTFRKTHGVSPRQWRRGQGH